MDVIPVTQPCARPLDVLRERFGHREFLPGQADIIDAVVAGRDAVAVMPTGSGKSLCYQVPALVRPGPALVVSPLIALMKDQVDGLKAAGIPATFVNSSVPWDELQRRMDGVAAGRFRILYVAPERFRSGGFRRALARVRLGLLAVDEAHCVSEWGHDFRPDYLRLDDAIAAARPAPAVACTATATPEVRAAIVARLGLADPRVLVRGFRRDNLFLEVERVGGAGDKLGRLADHLRDALAGPGSALVYCATRRRAEEVASGLAQRGLAADAYHGGLTSDARRSVQDRFMDGSTRCVVATNAFGMGVDKADVRFVGHHDLPGSPEGYYQEIGRAGRDGRPSRCVLLFNHGDLHVRRFLIEASNPPDDVVAQVWTAVLAEARAGGGIARCPPDALVGRCPSARGVRQVRAALVLLERSGALERSDGDDRGPPFHSAAVRADLLDSPRNAGPPVDFAEVRRRSDLEHRKLRRMVAYATGAECRHAFLLDYFGDQDCAGCRDGCDRCLSGEASSTRARPSGRSLARAPGDAASGPVAGAGEAADRTALTGEQVVAVRKCLSAAARLRGRYGMGRLAAVLTGGRDRKLVEAGHDRLPTHGALATWPRADVLCLLEALVECGCLRVQGADYPTVSLTEEGAEVMHARQAPRIHWPVAPTRERARDAARAPGAARSQFEEAEGDPALFEALRAVRTDLARDEGVPAYVIATDATLAALAQVRPRDRVSLLTCHGIGPVRAEKYGARFLQALSEWTGGRADAT